MQDKGVFHYYFIVLFGLILLKMKVVTHNQCFNGPYSYYVHNSAEAFGKLPPLIPPLCSSVTHPKCPPCLFIETVMQAEANHYPKVTSWANVASQPPKKTPVCNPTKSNSSIKVRIFFSSVSCLDSMPFNYFFSLEQWPPLHDVSSHE